MKKIKKTQQKNMQELWDTKQRQKSSNCKHKRDKYQFSGIDLSIESYKKTTPN